MHQKNCALRVSGLFDKLDLCCLWLLEYFKINKNKNCKDLNSNICFTMLYVVSYFCYHLPPHINNKRSQPVVFLFFYVKTQGLKTWPEAHSIIWIRKHRYIHIHMYLLCWVYSTYKNPHPKMSIGNYVV